MAIYKVGCTGCQQTSMHEATDDANAKEKHNSMKSHKEYEERVSAFTHGKDHNE
jgi:hypothetical protein